MSFNPKHDRKWMRAGLKKIWQQIVAEIDDCLSGKSSDQQRKSRFASLLEKLGLKKVK